MATSPRLLSTLAISVFIGIGAVPGGVIGAVPGWLGRAAWAQEEGGAFSVIQALPDDPAQGIRVEGGLLIDDLRTLRSWAEHGRALERLTPLGVAHQAAKGESPQPGLFEELVRIVDIAAPEPSTPIPAAIVAFTLSAGGGGLQAILKVEPDFPARLAASVAKSPSPGWSAVVSDDRIEITVGERTLVGRVLEGGWLRIAPDETMLVGAGSKEPLFAASFRRWVDRNDAVLFVRGGGLAAVALAGLIEDPTLSAVVSQMRGAALGWQYDGEKTIATRLLIDSPQVLQFAPLVRAPELQNHLVGLWDGDATAFMSLDLPPRAVEMVVPMLEGALADTPAPLSPALRDALGALAGQVGVVSFGAPGDWAVGLQLADPTAASALVPALRSWATEAARAKGFDLGSATADGAVPGATDEVLLARPAPDIEGIRFTSIDATVVAVRQRTRLITLLEHRDKIRAAPSEGSAIGTRLTPLIREIVERPAMASGYMLVGDDGTLFEWASWLAVGARMAMHTLAEERPEVGLLSGILDDLPSLFVLEGFKTAFLYDVALSIDLDDSVLVVQLATSEI